MPFFFNHSSIDKYLNHFDILILFSLSHNLAILYNCNFLFNLLSCTSFFFLFVWFIYFLIDFLYPYKIKQTRFAPISTPYVNSVHQPTQSHKECGSNICLPYIMPSNRVSILEETVIEHLLASLH